jgi:stage V sporulation protein AD
VFLRNQKIGRQTVLFADPPSIIGFGSAGGGKEGAGPLGAHFDRISADNSFGEKNSFEKSESAMQTSAFEEALRRARLCAADMDYLFGGDLLNQCIATAYAARGYNIPFFGLYNACSTMAESLILASMALDGGFGDRAAALTSSHFCTAERQYRSPLEYGGQRTPTAQWTATAAGAVVLSRHSQANAPYITGATVGKVTDRGIKDAANMGAAMAPAAYQTLMAHFQDTGRGPRDYDRIVTGDLGELGAEIVRDFFRKDGIPIGEQYTDCGLLLYDQKRQDVHAGGSGCGCSAAVLCGYLLQLMAEGRFENLLFCGTGALHSPTALMQKESIPGICHALVISRQKGNPIQEGTP